MQYAAIASLRKVSNKVELSAKSVLVHSCVGRLGVAGRERNYPDKVLTAAAPALSAALTHITDSGAMKKALEAQGLTVSLHSVQGFLRSNHETNWARRVLELLFLPEFLEHARETDPAGKYLLETKHGVYNSVDVDMFSRLFVSFGCFRKLVLQTDVLEFLAMDGAHLRRVFGGVLLSAVMPTANRQLCCLAFAVVESETEESCSWFVQHVLSQYPGRKFVWMTDQGVAITSRGVTQVLTEHEQVQSTCAKHLMTTLQASKQRKGGGIDGSLQGLQQLLFQFARARSKVAADKVLAAVKAKNVSVEKYLRARVNEIAAYAILKTDDEGAVQGHRRGGRITTQLGESWNNVCMPLRCAGLISGTIWACNYFAAALEQGRKDAASWSSDNYAGVRVASLAPNASKEFVASELSKNVHHRVQSFEVRTPLRLVGIVAKDGGTTRKVEVRRDAVGGPATVICGCLTHEEFGYPCARAVKLIQTANVMLGTQGLWDWMAKEFFAPFLWFETWKAQLECDVPKLVPPDGVKAGQPVGKKDIAEKIAAIRPGTPVGPVPALILKTAGRPAEGVRITRRKKSDHFARKKPAAEPSGKRHRGLEQGLAIRHVFCAYDCNQQKWPRTGPLTETTIWTKFWKLTAQRERTATWTRAGTKTKTRTRRVPATRRRTRRRCSRRIWRRRIWAMLWLTRLRTAQSRSRRVQRAALAATQRTSGRVARRRTWCSFWAIWA